MSQLLQYYKSFQQSRQAAAASAPTFEDLTIDDTLTELQRVVRYAKSTIGLQRLVHCKMLAYVASNQSYSVVVSQIFPLLHGFANDAEPAIRQNLVDQLAPLAKYCHTQGDIGYRAILDKILPIVSKSLEDVKPEVRQTACQALVLVASLVHSDDLGQHVLTIILRLAHDDEKEELRMTAAELLNMLAECLGQDLCRQFVIPEVVSLAEDPVFRVRKSTALNFHNICKIGGEHELFERLMPAFVRLSKDDMYRVRRACAESLTDISRYVSNDIRVGVLVEIFLRLTQDPSKLVKQTVLQQSGMFISTLPNKAVNDIILGLYCSMAHEPTGDVNVDAELKHYCAYSFPGVLQTIGSGRWHDVRDVYHTLVHSLSVNVKQTLAASLHEVARILSDLPDFEDELVPVFEEMIQDVEEIQMGIMKNLAVFLSLLPEPCRVSYLPFLHDILHTSNPFNWRLRQVLAAQLPALIDLPPKKDVFTMLFPLTMTLLQDPVAEVRKECYAGVAKLMNVLHQQILDEDASERSTSTHDLEAVIRTLNTLIRGETYQLRQLWIALVHRLIREIPKSIFEKFFIEGILKLACDSVSNVRISVSIFLTGWEPDDLPPWKDATTMILENGSSGDQPPPRASPWTWLLHRKDISECVQRLAKDDYDVYLNIIKLQPLFPEIEFEKISCRGKKGPPGGSLPIAVDKSSPFDQLDIITSYHRDHHDPVMDEDDDSLVLPVLPSPLNYKIALPPTPPPNRGGMHEEGENEELEDLMNTLDMGKRPL